jgi:DNA-binding MarR family transcriptional regulator
MSPRTFGALLAITERPGISQTELSRRLRIDRTTMSQLVDDLTHRKLIKRTVDPDDRRNHQLTMTSSGSRTLSRAVTAAADVERQLTAQLPAGRLAAVKEGLRQLLDGAPTTGPVCRDD